MYRFRKKSFVAKILYYVWGFIRQYDQIERQSRCQHQFGQKMAGRLIIWR